MSISTIRKYLDHPVDNTPLVLFRIAFGLLIVAESFGAILLGWVKRTFVEAQFNFTFIGFEWLQPIAGEAMYVYFVIMGILGVMVMIGYHYKISIGLFGIMWWGAYLMQKTSYNNHYYLLILLCLMMLSVPAHRNASMDVKRHIATPRITCPRWCIEIFKWKLLVVFTYAALAKLYPGWTEGAFIASAFEHKDDYPIIGDFLQLKWVQQVVMVGGIAYDLTIIPLLYSAKTRKFGVAVSIVFHLFNSLVFGIGIFPYLMLASLVLFFPVKHWQEKIPGYVSDVPEADLKPTPSFVFGAILIYFLIQLWLPVRHYFIPGNVFVTEEGHRMAWRMMLRSKYGSASFRMVDKRTDESWVVYPREYLTPKQTMKLGGRPDMIWQFTRFLQQEYAKQGKEELEIYANVNGYLNGTRISPYIDPTVDLLSVEWNRFGHNEWIVGGSEVANE